MSAAHGEGAALRLLAGRERTDRARVIDAVGSAPWMFDTSKHTTRYGGSGSPSARWSS